MNTLRDTEAIEKKVAEILDDSRTGLEQSSDTNKSRNAILAALREMYEAGEQAMYESVYSRDIQAEIKKEGYLQALKDMRERMPRIVDAHHSYYEVNRDKDLGLELMAHEIRSTLTQLEEEQKGI